MTASRANAQSLVEDAYRCFCRDSAPLWAWLTIAEPFTFVIIAALLYALGINLALLQLPFDLFDFVEYSAPVIIIIFFVYRGRRHVTTILKGTLHVWQIVTIATLTAAVGLIWAFEVARHGFGNELSTAPHLPRTAGDAYDFGIAPLAEEFVFQAALQTKLQRFGPVVAVIVTTVVFSVYHLGPGTIFDYYWLGGPAPIVRAMFTRLVPLLLFAVIRQRTKSLGAAILCHVMTNLFVVVTAK